jgi:hypothetical protein
LKAIVFKFGGNKMKLRLFLIAVYLLITASIFQTGCGWGSPDFTLTVVLGEGITGTPDSGTYDYKEFSEVQYKYDFDQNGIQPEIMVNNYRKLTLEDSLIMYCDIIMTVKQIDIRKEWTLVFSEADVDDINWKITFSGADLRSGTFSDDRGFSGTWEVTGTNNLTFRYGNWQDYVFTGTLTSRSGSWKGEGRSGTWNTY